MDSSVFRCRTQKRQACPQCPRSLPADLFVLPSKPRRGYSKAWNTKSLPSSSPALHQGTVQHYQPCREGTAGGPGKRAAEWQRTREGKGLGLQRSMLPVQAPARPEGRSQELGRDALEAGGWGVEARLPSGQVRASVDNSSKIG